MVLTSWDGLNSSQQKLFRTRFFGWGVAAIQKEPKVRLQTQAVGEFALRCLLMPKKWHIMYIVLSPECKYQKNKKLVFFFFQFMQTVCLKRSINTFLLEPFLHLESKKLFRAWGFFSQKEKSKSFSKKQNALTPGLLPEEFFSCCSSSFL